MVPRLHHFVQLEALTQNLKLPDLWQHAALNHLRAGSDVIVSAPTGAGKTFIFELFVKSVQTRRQIVYTVPTRALANDKHAEWKEAGWKVGLATGDRSENVGAPVLVATLETQMERLIMGNGPELLVIDEYQMIADPSRGSQYEGAIVLTPSDTKLLLLSGSVENPQDIATWMRRLGRRVEVVATTERPVPLEETFTEVLPQHFKGIEGYWPKLVASALVSDLAPLLIFAPRRKDAENIANKLADQLPQGQPLSLTNEQRALAGKDFSALLERRIAYHHSGLSYGIRAGLVEPLAKAGQLRCIVSTMGLAAGINFSVRTVHVSSTSFHDGQMEQQLTPDDLLQMFGRAGRRGLDERGWVLTSRTSPSLADARAARLRRSNRLSWPLFIRVMNRAALDSRDPFVAAKEFAERMFAKVPPELGLEAASPNVAEPAASTALFGLKGTKAELLNGDGQWEELRNKVKGEVSLAEAWFASADGHGPALSSQKLVSGLADGLGRPFKLVKSGAHQLYGKEIALGQRPPDAPDSLIPTQAMRRLLKIPRHLEVLNAGQIERHLLPRVSALFEGANLLPLHQHGDLFWARFDFSPKVVPCLQDSLGRWLVNAMERTSERATETEIMPADSTPAVAARPGTPVHSWRSLGLIQSDGTPTRRGVIFSFFQHGEGLAIAAALEDDSYPVQEIIPHLANLRSDCHFDLPDAGGSARLSAVCRATYGFVNHHGYLEAGLPLGYGEGTSELLNLIEASAHAPKSAARNPPSEIADGDLSRAYIEWLSLLRHILHAPSHDWPRWVELKKAAAFALEQHLAGKESTLHPQLPALTPKQRHDRPRHTLGRA
jgi:superfamily II DNA/RNA helicase